jgi:hypothetical protein
MTKRLIGAVALLAIVWHPVSATAQERALEAAGAVAVTAVGFVAGGFIASTVFASTTATVIGAAIGGGLAYSWYGSSGSSAYDRPLPRRSALDRPPSFAELVGLQMAAAKR